MFSRLHSKVSVGGSGPSLLSKFYYTLIDIFDRPDITFSALNPNFFLPALQPQQIASHATKKTK
jgi:hypothetical protein